MRLAGVLVRVVDYLPVSFECRLRIYTHYLGQWLFLQGIRVPVSEFTFKAVTVELNYQATLLLTREEIGVVVLGSVPTNMTRRLICGQDRWQCSLSFVF